ncbi:hypothetical protein IHE44_0002830 [Lamprotornis superbus]|uniref:Ig-like domain-containing protein n=1 Tax=Lamprotornis superbus TaxID=245042 RepID=A0A835P3I6_9PASS|nr:hypothetical protein IHE44_0002830 [Lamprotornis superbus]
MELNEPQVIHASGSSLLFPVGQAEAEGLPCLPVATAGMDLVKDVRQHLLCVLEASKEVGHLGFSQGLRSPVPLLTHSMGWALDWWLSGWPGIPGKAGQNRDLSGNRLTTLSWQLFQTLRLFELNAEDGRLERNLFNCSCDIRWIQLWQEKGEANLQYQDLYCMTMDAAIITLKEMNITQCDLPEISVSHVNLTVREGENAVITCNGSGSPLPDVDWTVAELHSINTHQTNLNWTNVHAINLTLVNVTSEDNGFLLTCIAENVEDMNKPHADLGSRTREGGWDTTVVQDPPRILTLEEPVLHMDHCIAFAVHGNPAPTLHWLHNGQVLRETEIIRMEFYQQGEVSEGCLLFNKPTHYNNGNYTIVATNQLGSANQTIKGHFLEKPFPGQKSLSNPKLLHPDLQHVLLAHVLEFPGTVAQEEKIRKVGFLGSLGWWIVSEVESTDNFVSIGDYEVSPTPPITVTHKPEEDTFGVSIAVGLAAFACVLLVVLFIMINKYGRRSKFGMKEVNVD